MAGARADLCFEKLNKQSPNCEKIVEEKYEESNYS